MLNYKVAEELVFISHLAASYIVDITRKKQKIYIRKETRL